MKKQNQAFSCNHCQSAIPTAFKSDAKDITFPFDDVKLLSVACGRLFVSEMLGNERHDHRLVAFFEDKAVKRRDRLLLHLRVLVSGHRRRGSRRLHSMDVSQMGEIQLG